LGAVGLTKERGPGERNDFSPGTRNLKEMRGQGKKGEREDVLGQNLQGERVRNKPYAETARQKGRARLRAKGDWIERLVRGPEIETTNPARRGGTAVCSIDDQKIRKKKEASNKAANRRATGE